MSEKRKKTRAQIRGESEKEKKTIAKGKNK